MLIALVEYLRSGTSLVGFLNNSLAINMLHKQETQTEEVSGTDHGAPQEEGNRRSNVATLQRSKRNRDWEVKDGNDRDRKR